jgi:hypothetical protein
MKIPPEHMPTKGNCLFEFKGGPLDKQGWLIDSDVCPSWIIADGHRYERAVLTFREAVGDTGDKYINAPDEPFEFEYRYKGKA